MVGEDTDHGGLKAASLLKSFCHRPVPIISGGTETQKGIVVFCASVFQWQFSLPKAKPLWLIKKTEPVVGGDTDHGGLPWLVSPPATDNFKYTDKYQICIFLCFCVSVAILFVEGKTFVVNKK